MPSAHSPNLQPDHAAPFTSIFSVCTEELVLRCAQPNTCSRRSTLVRHLILWSRNMSSHHPHSFYQLKLTAIPIVIAIRCQNKSTGIRRKNISTLIKDLPAGFSKCKAYLIIEFLWVFRKSSSALNDSLFSAKTIYSLC